MRCLVLITIFSVVKCFDPFKAEGEASFSSFDASDIKRDTIKNSSRPFIVTDPIPKEILNLDDDYLYEKYVEDEYLKNLNKRMNETLILMDKGGFMHKFTKTYLQRRMFNLAVPVANAYLLYLRKKAIKKLNETEADFRYHSNNVFFKKNMLAKLQYYYYELIFQHIPKIKQSVLDAGFEHRNGSMTRNDYHVLWEWETNFTCHFRDIADHLSQARNSILGEGDVALYSSLKPAYYQVELNNIAYIGAPFEEHHFKIS